MAWLITGGAGYIGSHVVAAARAAGHEVVVIDDLSTGFPDRLPADVPFRQADIADVAALKDLIANHDITGVVHLAARKQVGESMQQPLEYWEWNVSRMITMLSVLADSGVKNFVYSSSAAVYGQPVDSAELTETSACQPINPYGATKLAGEVLIESLAQVDVLRGVSLRYFNVAGTGEPQLADRLALNLIPIALRARSAGEVLSVFGTDYPTPDGTCIRDYVHVADLAEAHVAAMDFLAGGATGHHRFNIGTGRGSSVLDIVQGLEKAAGVEFPYRDAGRRAGDPAALVANVSKAKAELGWQAKRGLADILESAWAAWPR